MQLQGKTAFVTGGAQGIGKEYVRHLLKEGVKVVFGDREFKAGEATLAEMSEEFGQENVRFLVFDVTDRGKFQAAWRAAIAQLDHIDIMINNAAIMNEARWELMIDINVKSLIWGTEMAASHMRKDKGGRGGRIINIISALGLTTNFPSPIYSATKHAVRAYTSSLAQEPTLPQQGIEYALIAPDIVDTPLIRALDNSRMHHHDQLKDFIRDKQMEPHIVAEGLLQLLHLDNINGAVLSVEKERKTFRHVENVDDGPTFDPSKSAAGYV